MFQTSSVAGTGSASSTSGTSSDDITRTVKTELGKDDFLKLLITQLTHQDPLNPMEDKEFIAQMAQFSSLEQLTNLNAGLESMTNFAMTNAVNYIGRTVTFYNSDGEELSYKVTSVTFNQGEVTLHYDGGSVPLENVIGVA
ncbi:flagellar hook assembly protein FlgD [Aminiphilus sp.]|uniref:flagellar hook assembly protein FlgD n=1 Tax=Aminiphilus sp. TaxID=1872488 RepID=UPI001BCCC4DD|nr:flagellar hook assembly protein FlgD [Aminiphilus sp.]